MSASSGCKTSWPAWWCKKEGAKILQSSLLIRESTNSRNFFCDHLFFKTHINKIPNSRGFFLEPIYREFGGTTVPFFIISNRYCVLNICLRHVVSQKDRYDLFHNRRRIFSNIVFMGLKTDHLPTPTEHYISYIIIYIWENSFWFV